MSTDLTTNDDQRLVECEAKIDQSLRSFIDIGDALLEIRESRLYRNSHQNFEEYCQSRWNITKSRANQLISASRLVENLENEDANGVLPSSESVARELQRVDSDRQHEVWSQVVSTAPRGANNEAVVTARHVRETVERITAAPEPAPQSEGLTDATGEAVPTSVLPEYEAGIELSSIAAEVSQVAAKVRQMADRRGMALVNSQEIDRLLQQVREEIRFGIFYTSCQECGGSGAIFDGSPCGTCRGNGYLNRRMHSMTPETVEEESD